VLLRPLPQRGSGTRKHIGDCAQGDEARSVVRELLGGHGTVISEVRRVGARFPGVDLNDLETFVNPNSELPPECHLKNAGCGWTSVDVCTHQRQTDCKAAFPM
jgi:hypothetical protein